MTYHKGHYLGISLRDRNDVVLLSQLGLQLMVVANDAVMDDSDATSVVEMWMRIDISLVTVSGPAGVPDRHIVVMLGRPLHAHPLDAVTAEAI